MNLFQITSPFGLRVRVPVERWEQIITFKHPVMRGREGDVCEVLAQPDQIRRSRSDARVLLFYRAERPGRWICAVVKEVEDEEAFLITAYPTDAIKEGEQVWTR